MFKEPFVYQIECLDALQGARSRGSERGLAVMASGLGKTVSSALDAKKRLTEKDGKLLYLCHQNMILDQAAATFQEILGDGRRYGFFNGWENTVRKADTVFASLQTMRKHYKSFRADEWDHIIVDESHHSHAETYLSPIEYFRPRWKLGLTATPDRCDGRNIRSVFGDELYNLPLEDALVRNLVTPVEYRTMTEELSLDGLDLGRSGLTIDDINDKIFIRKKDEEIAESIAHHASEMEEPRIIVFASSIIRAEQLSRVISGSVTIHSHVSLKERLVRLELFRFGMIPTVVTVDCFNEGVDIPEANVIVFLRSTASPTIFLQQLGRGLRRFEGKKKVLVLDFVANCERITTLKSFSDVVEQRRKFYGELKGRTEQTDPAFSIDFDEKASELLDVIKRVRRKRIADTPELAPEFSSRNSLSAGSLSPKSSQEVWWKCALCSHEYKMSARMKLSGKGCPQCADRVTEDNNLAAMQPSLAKEYSPKNPLTPEKVKATSRESFLWNCGECGYEYFARARSRIHRGDSCPACSTLIAFYKSNMAFKLPNLQEEYSDVNILSPNRIHWKSNKAVWWTCKGCGRDWLSSVFARSVGQGNCPECTGKKATPTMNLVVTHPHFAEEYSSRNRKPVEEVFAGTTDKLWWLCFECGRYWEATVQERLDGKCCPVCVRISPKEVPSQ